LVGLFAPSVGPSTPFERDSDPNGALGDMDRVGQRGPEGIAVAFPVLFEKLRQLTGAAPGRPHFSFMRAVSRN
jgi:hypothetical protein